MDECRMERLAAEKLSGTETRGPRAEVLPVRPAQRRRIVPYLSEGFVIPPAVSRWGNNACSSSRHRCRHLPVMARESGARSGSVARDLNPEKAFTSSMHV